jgi:hypothetical protein
LLEANSDALSNLSRDFASHLSNHSSGLSKLRGFETCVANLSGSVNLVDIDLLVGDLLPKNRARLKERKAGNYGMIRRT